MDSSSKVPEYTVAVTWVATSLAVAVFGCGRSETPDSTIDASESRPVESALLARENQLSSKSEPKNDNRIPSQAQVDQAIEKAFAGRTPDSQEEREVVAFVEEYLITSRTPFPKSRKHIVSRRPDGWDVTLIDLDSLRRGDRPMDLTVHVKETNGRLKVTEGTIR